MLVLLLRFYLPSQIKTMKRPFQRCQFLEFGQNETKLIVFERLFIKLTCVFEGRSSPQGSFPVLNSSLCICFNLNGSHPFLSFDSTVLFRYMCHVCMCVLGYMLG